MVNATQMGVEHIHQGGRDLRLERLIQSLAENKRVGSRVVVVGGVWIKVCTARSFEKEAAKKRKIKSPVQASVALLLMSVPIN